MDTAGRPLARVVYVEVSGPGFLRLATTYNQGHFFVLDAPAGQTLSVQVVETYNDVSARQTVIPPDTMPPLVFPLRRESRGLRIDSAYVAGEVENRDPHKKGCVNQTCSIIYAADVGLVYFWTTVGGTTTPRTIQHVWYWEDCELARVNLVARGPRWRTWSSKRIDPSRNGRWRVDALADDGTLLVTRSFYIQSRGDTIPTVELQRLVSTTLWEAINYLRPGWIMGGNTSVYVNGTFYGKNFVSLQRLPRAGVRVIQRQRLASGDAAAWRVDVYTSSFYTGP